MIRSTATLLLCLASAPALADPVDRQQHRQFESATGQGTGQVVDLGCRPHVDDVVGRHGQKTLPVGAGARIEVAAQRRQRHLQRVFELLQRDGAVRVQELDDAAPPLRGQQVAMDELESGGFCVHDERV